jgi:signal peptidase I
VGSGDRRFAPLTTTVEPEPIEEDLDPPSQASGTFRTVLWFAAAIVVLLLVRTFLIEPVRVRSDSMEPTLRDGSVLLIDKVAFHTRAPHRGELIVGHDPRTGESIVKRVVAVAGDSVGIENGLLVVNGTTVFEKYIDNDNMEGFYFGPDLVPKGDVFLLGDNRDISVDSRAFGPVAVDDLDGRVLATIWSP